VDVTWHTNVGCSVIANASRDCIQTVTCVVMIYVIMLSNVRVTN
jgi:hypothetical protein